MTSNVLIAFCWVALGLTALFTVGGVAIGAAYHPETGLKNLAVSLLPIVAVGTILLLLPRTVDLFGMALRAASGVAGVLLIGAFGRRLAVDPGDAVLWAAPFALGLGLVVLAVVSQREAQA